MPVPRRTATLVGVAVATMATIGTPTPVVAAPARTQQQQLTNIAYAPAQPAGSRGHLLDLYLPSGGTAPYPLIIWSSGSAWTSDDGKAGAASVASTFTSRGYAVAGVSVRSSSQAKFPAQLHDVKAAIRWLRANAAEYQLDPDRFAISGDSSGGWVAEIAAVTGNAPEVEGDLGTTGVSSAVQAAVGYFGPTDFLQMDAQGSQLNHDAASSPESQLVGCAIQTCPDKVQAANPITYVDGDDPPMILMHGQADPLVPHGQSVLLYEALKAACVDVQFFSVPNAGHGTFDVLNASHHGAQTVYTSSGCEETITNGSPNPSVDLVDEFLREVFSRPAP